MEFPKKIFVAGTDTDVGKTAISAILTAGLKAAYWKPIQSGLHETTDTEWVREKTGLPESHFFPESYQLSEPLSPHESARLDGVEIDPEKIVPPEASAFPHLIVEGAGGVMVPLNDDYFMLDLIERLGFSVIITARSGLGTINHTLLTLEKLRERGLSIFGVALKGRPNERNRRAIEQFGEVDVIAEVPVLPGFSPESLKTIFINHFKPDIK